MSDSEHVVPMERWASDEFDRPPIAEVPDKFRSIDEPPAEPFELVEYTTEQLADISDEPIEPFVPDWVSVRANPRRAIDNSGFAPGVRSRGRKLTPLVVFPPDDRNAYGRDDDDFVYPWGCICRIAQMPGTVHGSGASGILVGPNHVLTASHLVNWDVPGGVSGVVEVQRYWDGFAARSPIVRVHACTRVVGAGVSWSELDEDYAVVETEDPLGERFGYVGVRRYDSDWDRMPVWTNVGYPWDRIWSLVPHKQTGKWLDEHGWDLGGGRAMDTDADLTPGNSGGPMFARFTDNGVYVVAVVSATNGEDRNYCSGGGDLVRLVRQARGL